MLLLPPGQVVPVCLGEGPGVVEPLLMLRARVGAPALAWGVVEAAGPGCDDVPVAVCPAAFVATYACSAPWPGGIPGSELVHGLMLVAD